MDRIDTPGSVAGSFVSANPFEGQVPTIIGSVWLNDIQEELVGWILTSGQALEKGAQAQILLGLLIISQAQLAASTGRELEVSASMPLAAGEMFALEDLFGLAAAGVSAGESVTMIRTGTRVLPKAAGETWLQGQTAYWDIAERNVSNLAGDGRKRIGFLAGRADAAATTGSVLLDGNSAPETAAAPLGSGLVKTISAPAGYNHTDAVRIVNQGQHLFIIWDHDTSAGVNIASLYTATDTNTTPIWTQGGLDKGSTGDHVREARDSGEFVTARREGGLWEISKWDTTGRLWASTRYGGALALLQRMGISADGTRIVLLSTDSVDPNMTEVIVLDGVDDVPTVKWSLGNAFAWNAELSSDGTRLIGYINSNYAVIDVDTGAIIQAGPCNGIIGDDFGDRQSFVAISADGGAFMATHQINREVRLGRWTGSAYSVVTLSTTETPYMAAISDDGRFAAVWEARIYNVNGDPVVTIYDVALGAVALDGKGVPLVFPLVNATDTAKGEPGRVYFSADGNQFSIHINKNETGPMIWIGETNSSTLTEVYTHPTNHFCDRAHFANGKIGTDVQQNGGGNGFVTLHNIT